MDQAKVKDRLRKLLALQERAGTEEESKAAAAQVARMLAKHGLTLSDVEQEDESRVYIDTDGVELVRKKTRMPTWIDILCAELSRMCGCFAFRRTWRMNGKREIAMLAYGRERDVQILTTLLPVYIDVVKNVGKGKRYRDRHRYGFACGLLHKMWRSRNDVMEEVKNTANKALVTVDQADQSEGRWKRLYGNIGVYPASSVMSIDDKMVQMGTREGLKAKIPGEHQAVTGMLAIGDGE